MLTENESERYEIAFNIRKGDDINNAVHFESSNCVQETTTCMVIIRTYVQPLKLWQGEKKKYYRLVLPHSKQPNSFSFTTQENTKSGLASPSATSGRVSHEIRQRRISCL